MSKIVPNDDVSTARIHLLPCTIEHNGEALVSTFFNPTPTGAEIEGLAVAECNFRGRRLTGGALKLPEGYSGTVIEKYEDVPNEDSNGVATHSWHTIGKFQELSYYNHDAAPLKSDGIQRSLEWATLAKHLHAPILIQQIEDSMI